jgi:hypothetical protein
MTEYTSGQGLVPGVQTLRIHLGAGRFTTHRVPLKVLARLERLEAALQAAARAHFFADNPERQRAPKHFEDQFGLELAELVPGSAVLEIEAPVGAGIAYAEVARGIGALVDGDDSLLPRTAWRALDAFFSGLHVDETVLLDGIDDPVAVPASLRGEVKLAARRRAAPRKLPLSIVGQVVGVGRSAVAVTSHDWEVEIQFREGTQRRALPISAADLPFCQSLLTDPHRLLRAVGSCHRGEEGELLDIVPGVQLSAVGGPSIERRFEELKNIDDGWLEGEGLAPSRWFLQEALRRTWQLVEQGQVDRPRVYPMPDGGIQLAWDGVRGSSEVEVKPDGKGGLRWSGLGPGEAELPDTSEFSAVVAWLRDCNAESADA